MRIDIHVHHHFPDGPVPVRVGTERPHATKAVLTVREAPPMTTASVNVDTVNEIATVAFVDSRGDTDAIPPAGVVITFMSDNPSALTIKGDPANPLQGDITVVGEGVANVGVSLTNADGGPLLEADGTPWASIDPVAVTVTGGAAVGAQLSVSP